MDFESAALKHKLNELERQNEELTREIYELKSAPNESTALKQKLNKLKVENEILKRQIAELKRTSNKSDRDSISTDSSDYTDSTIPMTIEQQLKQFDKIAATGQLFLKYSHAHSKPQDRIVKVSFDNKYKPKQISWGSGDRHFSMTNIYCITWGHYTPIFMTHKNILDPILCFSVITMTEKGIYQTLNLQAQSSDMAELWVKGLRKLIGHTDNRDDTLAIKFQNSMVKYHTIHDMKTIFNDEDYDQVNTMMNELKIYRNSMKVLNILFDQLDVDDNGDVEYDEFEYGLKKILNIDLNDSEIKQLFVVMDIDASGYIDRSDFKQGLLEENNCIELSESQNKIINYINTHNSKYKYKLNYKKCLNLNQCQLLFLGYIRLFNIKLLVPEELIELCFRYYFTAVDSNIVKDALHKKQEIYTELFDKIDLEDNGDISQSEFLEGVSRNISQAVDDIYLCKLAQLFCCMKTSVVSNTECQNKIIENELNIVDNNVNISRENDVFDENKVDVNNDMIILENVYISRATFVSFFLMQFESKLLNILKSSIFFMEEIGLKLKEIDMVQNTNFIDYSVYVDTIKDIQSNKIINEELSKEELIEMVNNLKTINIELQQRNKELSDKLSELQSKSTTLTAI
eukprot:478938_1